MVAQRDLETLATKTALFTRIIEQCNSSESLGKLTEYAREYFDGEEKVLKDCLVKILERILEVEEDHDKVLERVLAVRDELEAEDLEDVMARCEENKKELYVKLILKLEQEDKYESVCKVRLVCYQKTLRIISNKKVLVKQNFKKF